MTALKPIENRRVRAVASERYPLNEICAHPECSEPTADPHHAFPRSAIGGDSWFVVIDFTLHESTGAGGDVHPLSDAVPIPHVTGLCRDHHDDVEEHRAWIKLEEGVWVWYDRAVEIDGVLLPDIGDGREIKWRELGPLNPQPGSRTGKPKRRKFKGEARRKRATISIKVPQDEQEDGAGLWDEALETLEQKISGDNHRPVYYTIMDALNYTILNANEDDFTGGK